MASAQRRIAAASTTECLRSRVFALIDRVDIPVHAHTRTHERKSWTAFLPPLLVISS